jgi:YD repeat-containing protein
MRGLTSETSTTYSGSGGRTVVSVGPDGVTVTQTYSGGKLLSTITTSSDSTQLSSAVYTYDSVERLSTTTDARNGTTSYVYDANDRLSSITSPDPDTARSGAGYDPQVSTFVYDSMGRVSSTTQPGWRDCEHVLLPYRRGETHLGSKNLPGGVCL